MNKVFSNIFDLNILTVCLLTFHLLVNTKIVRYKVDIRSELCSKNLSLNLISK